MPIPFWAGRYIGLPFREHGRDQTGVDCWGLVRLVYLEQFSTCLPSLSSGYERTTSANSISALIAREAQHWQAVVPGKEECGDVIVLRVRGQPMHVGMVLGDGHMLHIEIGTNCSLEKYNGLRWKDRFCGFYRYKSTVTDDDNF
jgi:cell wall-associated NlpC family hydrolase